MPAEGQHRPVRRWTKWRRRRLGVLCGALLVPIVVPAAAYLARAAGVPPAGPSHAGQAAASIVQAAGPASPLAIAITPATSPSAAPTKRPRPTPSPTPTPTPQDMLNEKPPDDGHRRNILSSSFHHVGITVAWDSSGTVWMTQDFSN